MITKMEDDIKTRYTYVEEKLESCTFQSIETHYLKTSAKY